VILAIGSNRGLCGSYNSSVYRLVDVHVKRAKKLGKELDIYVQGRKLVSTLHFHGIEPTKVITDFDEVPTDEQAGKIADSFIDQYINGELDYFGIVYTRFYSVASQHAQTLTVLPISELIDDLTTRATLISPPEMAVANFDMSPSADELFDELATMIVRASVRSCFIDAALSQHLARVVAMRNATENADEMAKELTALYNRARQGQITSELLDIIGGVGVI
jgi:F-type H+-transporting ATPase subunit gamma